MRPNTNKPRRFSSLQKSGGLGAILSALIFGFTLVSPQLYPSLAGSLGFFVAILLFMVSLPLLVLLTIWAGMAWILARVNHHPLSTRVRNVLRFSLSSFIVLLLCIGLARWIPEPLPSGSHLQPFDRTVWANAALDAPVHAVPTPRQAMLASLVSQFPGRHQNELIAMMGPSLETGYFLSSGRDLIYHLGPQRDSLFAIDSEWLLIWVDESGRFERYAIVSD